MKPHAEESKAWGKEVYATLHQATERKEIAEAIALGCDQSTAHNYLDLESDRHLPYGLVPNSLYAHGLAEALCERLGGAFIHVHGKLNGSTRDEISVICKALSEIVKRPASEQEKYFAVIENAAARARLENSTAIEKV